MLRASPSRLAASIPPAPAAATAAVGRLGCRVSIGSTTTVNRVSTAATIPILSCPSLLPCPSSSAHLSLSLLFLSLFSFFFFFSTRLMPLPLPPPFLSLPSLLFLVSLASSLPPPPLRNFFTSRNEKKSEGENLGLEVERDIPAGRWLDFESSSRTETIGSGSNGPRWWTTSTDAGLPRCSIDSGA